MMTRLNLGKLDLNNHDAVAKQLATMKVAGLTAYLRVEGEPAQIQHYYRLMDRQRTWVQKWLEPLGPGALPGAMASFAGMAFMASWLWL